MKSKIASFIMTILMILIISILILLGIFVYQEIYNEDRESVEVANHPMEILYLKCEQPLSEFDMGRKVLTNEK